MIQRPSLKMIQLYQKFKLMGIILYTLLLIPHVVGLGCIYKKKLDFVRRRDFEFKIASCETCFIELFTHNKQKNIIIGVIYRHPHGNHTEFIHKLQCTAENILKKYSLIILGDINLNVSVPNENLSAKMYKDHKYF